MEPPGLLKDSYTVGWIAALSKELTAAIQMLDTQHPWPSDFTKSPTDPNVYVWGRIGDHNVVIAFLEAGAYGTTPAATTATYLLTAFPNIKIGLMVGIGAGIRRKGFDVRLGDVVISHPDGKSGGVYQYDLRKARSGDDSEMIGILNRPSTFLLKVLALVKAHHLAKPSKVPEHLNLITPNMADPLDGSPGYVHQGIQNDRLFKSTFSHISAASTSESEFAEEDFDADDPDPNDSNLTCPHCSSENEVKRHLRGSGIHPQFHYGTIASGNTLIKDAEERNRIAKRVPGSCICFEMEAAGLMNNFPCLVIRGICDYADSHKNDRWQPYAALTAAAYAKEFLETVPGGEVQQQTPLAKLLENVSESMAELRATTTATNLAVQAAELKEWLSPPDPSINYVAAIHERNKGVVGTGSWFLHSSEYSEWNSTERSFLWLHGPAGCGKTVLSSTVIQHLLSEADKLPESIVLYYYFAFNDAHTLSQNSFIRSLVVQLSQQDERARKDLQGLRARKSGSRPTEDELFEVFCSITSHFNRVMIVLDGLDELETKKRPDVLHWITNFRSEAVTSDIRVFASSRSEHDIETKLKDIHLEVRLRPEMIQEDIKDYVHKHVHDDESELRRWRQRPNTQLEIENVLTEKAHGMFRWVVCQLGAIEECLDLPSLREQLNSLPETLDGTYDRMIHGLMKRKQKGAIELLQFLAFAERPLLLEEAVDVVAVDLSSCPAFDPENRMPDQLEIVKVCSSLVVLEDIDKGDSWYGDDSRNSKRKLQLAHFSVKEYLVSDRLQGTLQPLFTTVNAHASIVNLSLGYLFSVLPYATGDQKDVFCGFPLVRYASEKWPIHARLGEKTNQTFETICKLLEDRPFRDYWILLHY